MSLLSSEILFLIWDIMDIATAYIVERVTFGSRVVNEPTQVHRELEEAGYVTGLLRVVLTRVLVPCYAALSTVVVVGAITSGTNGRWWLLVVRETLPTCR
jgi:hypothetical protein